MTTLTPESYRTRVIDEKIDAYLNAFGAVCLEGPKWCGKTWTALNHAESVCYIASPEKNFQNRSMAQLSPELVLAGKQPRAIDEWQDVPAIWDAVRFKVDQSPQKGQFILTGSSTPNHKGILHSGAGRIGRLRMNTMSLFEMGDSSGLVSLQDLIHGPLSPVLTGDISLNQLIYYCVRGGWPASVGLTAEEAMSISSGYLEAVVSDDMFRLDGIKRDTRKVRSLLHSLGRNESTIVSNTTLKKDVEALDGLSLDTGSIADYLSVFERLFIIDDQPAFSTSMRSSRKLLKSPKRHYTDPSLAVAALGATPQMLLNDLNTLGFIFESLCEHDLKIYAESFNAKLYHLRDERNHEIDAVIELPDGNWAAFEIKLGANQIDKAADELIHIQKIMKNESKPPIALCVICGLTNYAYTRPDGVHVVPVTALRP